MKMRMIKNDPIYFEQSILDRFLHPSTKLGKFARNISVFVAGIALAVGAFFTLKPNPKEDLTDQFKQNLNGLNLLLVTQILMLAIMIFLLSNQ
jgi:hypothetical protein